MKRILFFLAAILICVPLSGYKQLDGTLVRTGAADPCLIYHDGFFYLTMTGTSRLALIKDESLSCLTTADYPVSECIIYDSRCDLTVTDLFGPDAVINGTWSPEIHYFSEEDFPGMSGWYLYFALRKKVIENGKVKSRDIRMVTMKSLSGKVEGPYGSPQTGQELQSQPFLKENGEVITDWCAGPSLLKISSGKHRGMYLTWVEEVGRGEGAGKFYQKIMISRISSPWQLAGTVGVVTYPTQEWEFHGSSEIHPRVVEGGTAVYGDHGEIYLTYSGSGYWSDYGIGQLTLRREKDDYADPLQTESWIKYRKNPIFTSEGSEELRGAGHAFFLKDEEGKRFFCYHAYPVVNGKKAKGRNAYIEPYSIDYSSISPTAPYGVLRMGAVKGGICAPVTERIKFKSKECLK